MFSLRTSLGIFPTPWLFALVATSAWLEAAHDIVSSGSAQGSKFSGETSSPHETSDHRARVRGSTLNEHHRSLFAATKVPHDLNRETAMIYRPEIKRHCHTRAEAHHYLASRGFLLLPRGWANGHWQAQLESEREGVIVSISLEVQQPDRRYGLAAANA